MTRGRLIVAALLAALLTGGAWSLYWVWAADRLSAAIEQWTAEQRARGYDIAYQGPDVGGYPLALTARFAEPTVAAPQGWRWSGGGVAGAAALWRPQTLHLELPRRQELAGTWDGQAHRLRLEAGDARGLVHLGRGGRLEAATVEMEDVSLVDEAGRTLRAAGARAAVTQRPPRLEGTEDWTLVMTGEARDVALPEPSPSPLGAKVELLAFKATLVGAIPGGAPAEALARWRDSGGRLQVADLAFVWGPLQVQAQGAAALDQALRPEGAFTARLRGLNETTEALLKRGLIKSKAALAVRFAVLALAKTDPDGQPVVTVPVTLRDGLLYLGPVALFAVGPVL